MPLTRRLRKEFGGLGHFSSRSLPIIFVETDLGTEKAKSFCCPLSLRENKRHRGKIDYVNPTDNNYIRTIIYGFIGLYRPLCALA